jgi:hypothetical protein
MPVGLSTLLSLWGTLAVPGVSSGLDSVQAYWFSELGAVGDAPGRALLTMPWTALWMGNTTRVLERPEWIIHVVTPRERLSQIAVRYGVEQKWVREWNDMSGNALRPRQKLHIRAHRLPPPREKRTHTVGEGETWGSIAAAWRVETPDLRAWNYGVREPRAGESLTVWFDPGAPWTVFRALGPPTPNDLGVAEGGISVGRPNRGRIRDAVQVPDLPLYTRRNPDILWGSTHAVRQLVQAFAVFRHESGYEGEVIIGSMSRRSGGRFRPHRSHQSGRDVDIRLPLLPGVAPTHEPNQDEVDWQAAWALVRALVDTGEVHAIYLETGLQRRLYEAARQTGATHEELVEKIQWPRSQEGVVAVVRHEKGHDGHLHVRFTCGVQEDRCKTDSR